MKGDQTASSGKTRIVVTLAATVAALSALLVPMMIGSPAGATPSHVAATGCTIYPVGACPSTTTSPTTVPSTINIGSLAIPVAPKGTLAFTGADLALVLLAAALLIVLGYAIVRLNKQRRPVHKTE
jgi:hypothetical protein